MRADDAVVSDEASSARAAESSRTPASRRQATHDVAVLLGLPPDRERDRGAELARQRARRALGLQRLTPILERIRVGESLDARGGGRNRALPPSDAIVVRPPGWTWQLWEALQTEAAAMHVAAAGCDPVAPFPPDWTLPVAVAAVEEALQTGYRVDVTRGLVIGRTGVPLTPSPQRDGKSARVGLYTPGIVSRGLVRSPFQSIRVHRVVGYARWGRLLSLPGLQVRHLSGDVQDSSWSNLALGTAAENRLDIPETTRRELGRTARRRQETTYPRGPGEKLTHEQLEWLSTQLARAEVRDSAGRFRYGARTALADALRISPVTVSRLAARW